METVILDDKKFTIKKLEKKDLKGVKKFQEYINALVEEEAMLLINRKFTLKEEKEALEGILRKIKNKTEIFIFAKCGDDIAGVTSIALGRFSHNHIGTFGISIAKKYRGIGLGKALTASVIEMAKKELNPSPKIIDLIVFVENKIAISLYKKMGFKKVARLPKQAMHKGKFTDDFVMHLYL